MKPLFYPDYQIAAGNDNAAGLVSVETLIAPTSAYYIVAPTVRGGYTPGQNYVRGNGLLGTNGFARVNWHFSLMHYVNDVYFRLTYCAAGFSGLVTVKTRLFPSGAFANYNAVLTILHPIERDEAGLGRVNNYIASLTRMVAI